ncbi:ferredoxin [Streptomyces sp. NBC_01618]|uniref:ferredoxin n=1 Tax=Streptomyces sp. NBC_01618 TaxID=2975900 RepID=UPI003867881F|nr:ferredoxin [Streptomyces sp. NBC_01618]
MTSTWQIVLDRSCRRSGICSAVAPQYFSVDADHRTRVAEGPVDPDPELLDVVAACPAEAISIVDRETGRPVPTDPDNGVPERRG